MYVVKDIIPEIININISCILCYKPEHHNITFLSCSLYFIVLHIDTSKHYNPSLSKVNICSFQSQGPPPFS